MNLRLFHIVFVVAATLLAAWLAAFCLAQWRRGGGGVGARAGAIGSGAVACGLVAYGTWFVRKTRHL